MKRFMRGVLVIWGAGLAYSAQGGTITSGSFHVGVVGSGSATVSGENFTATALDTDLGPFIFSGLPPFQAPPIIPGLTWGGLDFPSGVLYNGVFFPVFDGGGTPHNPISSVTFTETLISPKPIVTGPGTYSLDLFSVTLTFVLRDSSGTIFHSETDTGFATGSITYTACGPDTAFVCAPSFQATIIPEPSTWSSIASAACCLGALAGIRLRRQLPGRRFQ